MPKISNWGDSGGFEKPTNAFGQTQKQQEMSKATSPKAANAPNDNWGGATRQRQQAEVTPDREIGAETQGGLKVREVTETAKKKEQEKSQYARERTEKLVNKLGPAGFQVQAAMNKVLNPNAVLSGNAQVSYDEQLGHQITGSEEADIGAISTQVASSIEDLQATMAGTGLFDEEEGELKAKSMRELLAEESNTLREQRPEEAAQVNKLLRLADRLKMLSERGKGNTTEAQQIKAQILAEDDQGLVQGLYEAQSEYEAIMHGGRLEFEGDDAFKTVGPKDLLNLEIEEIKSEVEKALIGQSGMFSGEYANVLRQQVDELTKKFDAAAQAQLGGNKALQQAATDVLRNFQSSLTDHERFFKDALERGASELEQLLTNNGEKLKALSIEDQGKVAEGMAELRNREGENGYLVMELIGSLGNGNYKQGAQKLIEAGLFPPDLQGVLEEFLDNPDAEEAMRKGKISQWLEALSTNKPITYKGRTLTLGGAQKAMIIRAAENGNTDQIEAIFEQAMREINVDIGSILEGFENVDREGFSALVTDTASQISKGMENFAHSEMEDALKSLLRMDDKAWDALSTDERVQLMREYASSNGPEMYQKLVNKAREMAENLQEDLIKNLGLEQKGVSDNHSLMDELLQAKEDFEKQQREGKQGVLGELTAFFDLDNKEKLGIHVQNLLKNPSIRTLAEDPRSPLTGDKLTKLGSFSVMLEKLKHMTATAASPQLREKAQAIRDAINQKVFAITQDSKIGSAVSLEDINVTLRDLVFHPSSNVLLNTILGTFKEMTSGDNLQNLAQEAFSQLMEVDNSYASYLDEMIAITQDRIDKGNLKVEALTKSTSGPQFTNLLDIGRLAGQIATKTVKGELVGFGGSVDRPTHERLTEMLSKNQRAMPIGEPGEAPADSTGLGQLGKENFFNPDKEESLEKEASKYKQTNIRDWVAVAKNEVELAKRVNSQVGHLLSRLNHDKLMSHVFKNSIKQQGLRNPEVFLRDYLGVTKEALVRYAEIQHPFDPQAQADLVNKTWNPLVQQVVAQLAAYK